MDEIFGFHLPPRPMAVREWLWQAKINPGESLTSLVARQGRACAMGPTSLLRALDYSGGGKLPDLDVQPPEDLLQALSRSTNNAYLDLRRATLLDHLSIILPTGLHQHHLGKAWRAQHSPWLLPNGWQTMDGPNETRPGGIPFCPMCFAEGDSPWFPLLNRFCLTVVCLRHRILLWDQCPRCQSPISPYSLLDDGDWTFEKSTHLCVGCLDKKAQTNSLESAPPALSGSTTDLLRFQRVIHSALCGEDIEVPQIGRMTAKRFLSGLRYAITAAGFLVDHGLEPEVGVEHGFSQLQQPLFPRL